MYNSCLLDVFTSNDIVIAAATTNTVSNTSILQLPAPVLMNSIGMNNNGNKAAARFHANITQLIKLAKLRHRKEKEEKTTDLATKARLRAIRAPGASRFMKVSQRFGSAFVNNETYRSHFVIRHGLQPSDFNSATCPKCSKDYGPNHELGCVAGSGSRHVTIRHDSVRNIIIDHLQQIGGVVTKEPQPFPIGDQTRPDVEWAIENRIIYFDILTLSKLYFDIFNHLVMADWWLYNFDISLVQFEMSQINV